MSFGLIAIAFVTVTNAPRVARAVWQPQSGPISRRALLIGCLLVFVAAAILAAVADPILDALDVSPETFALAGAAVVAFGGLRVIVVPRFRELPALKGLGGALAPIAVPLLFTPELAMLMVTAATLEGIGEALGALLLALVIVLVVARISKRRTWDAFLVASARLLAAGAVAVGVAIALDAIYNV
jgi:small neutral amino acid transporter SnatA (MarC family)